MANSGLELGDIDNGSAYIHNMDIKPNNVRRNIPLLRKQTKKNGKNITHELSEQP